MGLHHHDFHNQRREPTQQNSIPSPYTHQNKTKQEKPKRVTTTSSKSFKTMKVKTTLINFKSKLSKSCNRFVSLFRFRVKRPVFIRPLRARHGNVKLRHNHHHPQKRVSSSSLFLSCLCFLSTNKDQEMSNTKPRTSSFSVNDDDSSKFMQSPLTPATAKKLFNTPITTPVYVAQTKKSQNSRDAFEDNAVEDACKGFENYLLQLIVEEGKMEDITDIEELLFCWKNLKSPVFIELVSRFYGELCRDLFSGE